MGERTQLSSSSPQFARIEYTLQLCLKASTAKVIAAYAISNPHLNVQFERKCKVIS